MRIPYEIHITLDASNNFNIERFKQICGFMSVKPIVLDLEINNETVMKDVMTSSHCFGNEELPHNEVNRICSELQVHGYKITRVKIETAPWHPKLPRVIFPFGNYFESHIAIYVEDIEQKNKLNDLITKIKKDKRLGIHLSRNFFKKNPVNNHYKIMATIRSDLPFIDKFEEDILYTKQQLEEHNFVVEKPIIEYAIFDSNVMHDYKWIEGLYDQKNEARDSWRN